MIAEELLNELKSLVKELEDFKSQTEQQLETEDKITNLQNDLANLKDLKRKVAQAYQRLNIIRKDNKQNIKAELDTERERIEKEISDQESFKAQLKVQEEELQRQKREEESRLEKARVTEEKERRREEDERKLEEAARNKRLEAQRKKEEATREREAAQKEKDEQSKKEQELLVKAQEVQQKTEQLKKSLEKLTPKKRAVDQSASEVTKRTRKVDDPVNSNQEKSEAGDADMLDSGGKEDNPGGGIQDQAPRSSDELPRNQADLGEGGQNFSGGDYDIPPDYGDDDRYEQSPDEYRKSLVEDLLKIKVLSAQGEGMDLFSSETASELRKVASEERSGQIDPADFLARIISQVMPDTVYESLDLSGDSVSKIISKIDQAKGKTIADEISARFQGLDSGGDNADLLFHIKRFNADQTKNDQSINYDSIFIKGRGTYELTAFIVHRGGVSGGHYVAYVKEGVGERQSKWFLYDDDKRIDNFRMDQDGNLPLEAKDAYFAKYSDMRLAMSNLPSQQSGFSNPGKNYCWLNSSLVFLRSFKGLNRALNDFIEADQISFIEQYDERTRTPVNDQGNESGGVLDCPRDQANQLEVSGSVSAVLLTSPKIKNINELKNGLTGMLNNDDYQNFVDRMIKNPVVALAYIPGSYAFASDSFSPNERRPLMHFIAFHYSPDSFREILSIFVDALIKNGKSDQEIELHVRSLFDKQDAKKRSISSILDEIKRGLEFQRQRLDYALQSPSQDAQEALEEINKEIQDLDETKQILLLDVKSLVRDLRDNPITHRDYSNGIPERRSRDLSRFSLDPRLRNDRESISKKTIAAKTLVSMRADVSEVLDDRQEESVNSPKISSADRRTLLASIKNLKFADFYDLLDLSKKKYIAFDLTLVSGGWKRSSVLHCITKHLIDFDGENSESSFRDCRSLLSGAIESLISDGKSDDQIQEALEVLVHREDKSGNSVESYINNLVDNLPNSLEEWEGIIGGLTAEEYSEVRKNITDAMQGFLDIISPDNIQSMIKEIRQAINEPDYISQQMDSLGLNAEQENAAHGYDTEPDSTRVTQANTPASPAIPESIAPPSSSPSTRGGVQALVQLYNQSHQHSAQ